jgi:hypothetical protein
LKPADDDSALEAGHRGSIVQPADTLPVEIALMAESMSGPADVAMSIELSEEGLAGAILRVLFTEHSHIYGD